MEKHHIHEWRKLKGLSQEELGRRVGVTMNTIRAWEQQPDHIQIRYVPLIAVALDVPQDNILFSPLKATSSSVNK